MATDAFPVLHTAMKEVCVRQLSGGTLRGFTASCYTLPSTGRDRRDPTDGRPQRRSDPACLVPPLRAIQTVVRSDYLYRQDIRYNLRSRVFAEPHASSDRFSLTTVSHAATFSARASDHCEFVAPREFPTPSCLSRTMGRIHKGCEGGRTHHFPITASASEATLLPADPKHLARRPRARTMVKMSRHARQWQRGRFLCP